MSVFNNFQITLQIEPNKVVESIFPEQPNIVAIVIALLFVIGIIVKVVDFFSKVKDAKEGFKILKDIFFFWKKPEVPNIKKNVIIEDDLMTVENPTGFYVENKENTGGLLKVIRNSKERIICVVGPPGIGKTKLVQYLCVNRLKNIFKLQIYVDFEAINSPTDTTKDKSTDQIFNEAHNSFMRSFGRKQNNYDTLIKIAKCFQTPTLIFVDNYEQIKDNPSLDKRIQSEIIKPLRDYNPLITIVITSRESISGADNFEVKSLSNIELSEVKDFKGDLLSFKAIHLFCKIRNDDERKHRRFTSKPYKKKDFSPKEFLTIVELCHLVSNLPLGIRLIASRSVDTDIITIKDEINYVLSQDLHAHFGELTDRHTNLYSVFNWSFRSLSKNEKEFYRHLASFKNGFFKDDIPTWPKFKSSIKTRDTISKLHRKSFLREQAYVGASGYRYEVYTLFKQLLNLKYEQSPLNRDYLNQTYQSYLSKLKKMNSILSGANVELIAYDKIKADLRLDIENIEHFIENTQHNDINLAIDLLVYLEKVLNEVGPYIVLEKLYDTLLNTVKNPIQKARLLMSKARVVKSSENRVHCIAYIKEAITILEAQKEITPILGEAYRIGTYLSSQVSQYKFGEDIIKSFDQLSQSEQLKLGKLNCAFIMQEKAKKHERDVQFNLAESCYLESLKLIEGYKVQQAQILNYSGLFYWRMGHSDTSEKQLKQAISNYKGIGEDRWILGFKTNLGLLYCDQGRLDWALEQTEEAYEVLKHQGPYGWSLVNLLNKGRIFARYDKNELNFKKSEELLLDATAKLNDVGYGETETLGYLEIAELYYRYEKYNKAYDNAQKSLKLGKENNIDKWMRAFRAWCILGLVEFKNNDMTKSAFSLQTAEQLLSTVDNNKWLTYKITRKRYNELMELHKEELIPYPWQSFLKEKETFKLFGYGSLINQYSSQKTIKDSIALTPVMGYGIKRFLNYDPDENVRSRALYQDPQRGEEYFGAFNLKYTGHSEHMANGVLRTITKSDFDNLVAREVGYALVKIKCKPFNDLNAQFIEAYTLVAPQEYNGRKLVNNELLPNVPYYKICREGAEAISQKFLDVWLNTSFLGDGRNVRVWEKDEGLEFEAKD